MKIESKVISYQATQENPDVLKVQTFFEAPLSDFALERADVGADIKPCYPTIEGMQSGISCLEEYGAFFYFHTSRIGAKNLEFGQSIELEIGVEELETIAKLCTGIRRKNEMEV